MARTPCEVCGCTLWYHEREQRFCRTCAGKLGVSRICDARNDLRDLFDFDGSSENSPLWAPMTPEEILADINLVVQRCLTHPED